MHSASVPDQLPEGFVADESPSEELIVLSDLANASALSGREEPSSSFADVVTTSSW